MDDFHELLLGTFSHGFFRRAFSACTLAVVLPWALSGTSYMNTFGWTISMSFFAGPFS